VLIDEQGGLIAGHGRVMAAKKLSIEEVPCIVLDGLTEAQKKAYIIADNQLPLNAGWDLDKLQIELETLKELDFNIDLLGFDDEFIDGLMPEDEVEGLTDADEVPEPPEVPVSVLGDIWQLGNHRLMCGDSTSIDAVEKLMGGQKADMVFTDPPYGIAYSSDKFSGNKKGVTNTRNSAPMIIGDDHDFDPSFIYGLFSAVKEVFIWGFQYYPDKLPRGGIIVWNKKKETETDNPHGDFELCWSKSERNKMCWLRWGGFNNKEKGEGRLHTTQKPVELALWFLENWGKKKNNIVDIFAGSGFTLIACEKTNRNAFLMELDEKYVDVIINRWQNFTGKQAIHIESGKTYNEMKDDSDGR
jgi:DNA modification methylase